MKPLPDVATHSLLDSLSSRTIAKVNLFFFINFPSLGYSIITTENKIIQKTCYLYFFFMYSKHFVFLKGMP
jgi:hypothetical protein